METQEKRIIHFHDDFKNKLLTSYKKHKNNPESFLGHHLYLEGSRTPLFQLQGLFRIEKKIGKNKKRAEELLIQLKELEDAIGKYDYWYVMMEYNKRWRFPDKIQKYFESQAIYQLGVLEERLIKNEWLLSDHLGLKINDKGSKSFTKKVKKSNFYNSSKEKRKLLELFRDEALEIHNSVEKSKIDFNDLELGIHELRRDIRWIGIYSSALLGKIRIDKSKPGQALHKFVTRANSSKSFNKLPFNENQIDPIYFLPGAFYAMSELISKIGDIKDAGLCTEEMLRIGKMFGMTPAKIKKHLGKDYYSHHAVIKDAKKLIQHYVLNEKVLLHMSNHFNHQIKNKNEFI